ncbi:MAG: serine/threonine-protein kinase [Verrucomicrobiota bacterium]
MNPTICPTCRSPIPPHAPGGFCPACLLRDAEEPPITGRAAPSLEEIAAAFPQLEIIRLIGQGGMGFVYEARQPNLDRTVALKILSPELGRDPAFAERFAREARVLGKLSHPNIVTVFEHGETGGFFQLTMEYVDGVNLRQAMRAGRFTPEQALAVVPEICDALQAAHAQGIWHRDIKPENILLDRDGRVKIADFGIARIVGDPLRDFTLTRTGGVLGSVAYMAPEQHESPHDVDHRADIYSLGVVIYEMLTGELPLGRFPSPSQRATVDARIDSIVLRTLEKERELRQQSATEVKTDVLGAAVAAPETGAKAWSENELHGKLALGLFLAGIFGLLVLPGRVVLPGSAGFIPAGSLCAVAFLLALVFGLVGWRERLGKAVVIGMGILAVMGGVAVQYSRFREMGLMRTARLTAADENPLEAEAIQLWGRWRATLPADPNRTYVLRPVIEMELPQPGPGVACMLHFKNGSLHAPDDALADQMKRGEISYAVPEGTPHRPQVAWDRSRWLQQVNAVVTMPDGEGIQLFSTQPFPLVGKNFDAISEHEIVDAVVAGLERTDFQQAFVRSFSRREFIRPPAREGNLFSFIAPSETGATLGVMEVLGPTSDRSRIRVRYRLLGWYTAVIESTSMNLPSAQGTETRKEIAKAETGDRVPGEAVAAIPAAPAVSPSKSDTWRKNLPEEVRVKFSENDLTSLLRDLGWVAPREVKGGGPPAKIDVWGNDFSNFDHDTTQDWVIQVRSSDARNKPISGILIYDLTEHGWTCIAKLPGIFPVGWNHEFEGRKGFYTQESIPGEPPINQRCRYFRWDGNRYIEDRVEYERGG